jgi:starch-binding outer membrane protein, SusD/RagB family
MRSLHIITKRVFLLLSLFLVLCMTCCKKLVEVTPPVTSITDASVYNSDATAIAVLTGLYAQLSQASYPGNTNQLPTLSLWAALSADELTLWDVSQGGAPPAYYGNTLTATDFGPEFWNNTYPMVFICNSAIAGVTSSTGLTPAVKQQLLGEAKFMRAMFYFYLVNLYGDVPLALTTNYQTNAALPRTPKTQVYNQIIEDLKEAENSLSANFPDGSLLATTTERTRPTKWAAQALLARTYLYTNDWPDAIQQADSVINSGQFALTGLDSVFLMNSTEAIWQLQPVTTGVTNTQDGYLFIIPSTGPSDGTNPVYLSPFQLNSFEPGDLRRTNWVDSVIVGADSFYFPYKYKVNAMDAPVTEYLMMLRLGELYLIRSEAEAQTGDLAGAASDLNTIRTRAGLPNTAANTQAALLAAIFHERQTELFTELGQRWLDLKRLGKIDSVMTTVCPLKGGVAWNTDQQLFPLPLSDIQKNSKLIQNQGY